VSKGTKTHESVAFGGGRIRKSGSTYAVDYHITDHLGSVRAIVNASGTVVEQNDYYPFGARQYNPFTARCLFPSPLTIGIVALFSYLCTVNDTDNAPAKLFLEHGSHCLVILNLPFYPRMNRATIVFILTIILGSILIHGCGTQRKLNRLQDEQMRAQLALSDQYETDLPEFHVDNASRDTFEVVDFDGRKTLIMNAIRDESGEMVATDVIQAAVVTARFRNVAERHGKVDIRFQVIVPPEMQDSKWQLRFYPDMYVLEDSTRLDPIIITGNEYRARQLRGYERYTRFLSTIVTDTTRFIDMRNLEIFIKRNIPELYALKTDSTFISDDRYASIYGVSARQAIDHYTNRVLVRRNDRRKARREQMYARYVKAPIITEGIRLDTVLTDSDGAFVYEYVQTINTRPKLSKVDVVLSGHIFEEDRQLYTIPRSEPLSFYISSLSAFVDPTERYMTKIIERRVEANTACWIAFETGKSDVNPAFGNNPVEIGRIKDNLGELLENKEFDLDSITVTASCSPEGTWKMNTRLSQRRAESVSGYFEKFIRHYRDSLKREEGLFYNLGEPDEDVKKNQRPTRIRFISRSNSENWPMLVTLVASDTQLTEGQKQEFSRIMEIPDPDIRELSLSKEPYYKYLRESLYPYLRTVKFDFYLHRKGMVKDTVHTTVLDETYMRGIQAIRDRDYETAVTVLRPYNDYNAAVAFTAMDYNASAMAILETLKPTDRVEYLLAVLYSRRGDDQQAVQHYLNSVALNHSYVYRGNLDPEISVLIKKYGLNSDEEE